MEFNHVRTADLTALRAADSASRTSQSLLDQKSGAQHIFVKMIRTPTDTGSLAGMHAHDYEQLFYIVAGVMSVELGEKTYELPAGTLFVIPPGVPHKAWNATPEEVLHLSINSPLPTAQKAGAAG